VSSHEGADDKPNTVGSYVKRGNKAWTQANYNPVAVSLELCGFASWSTSQWKNDHHTMLENCAAWIREEADYYGIAITRLTASQAQGSGRGVCQHVDLGAGGGNHHDCGAGFPMDYVLDLARGGSSSLPTPPEEANVAGITSAVDANGNLTVWYVDDDNGKTYYTWQRRGESKWQGGKEGVSPAGWKLFAPKP
jgi:hypothetical protein